MPVTIGGEISLGRISLVAHEGYYTTEKEVNFTKFTVVLLFGYGRKFS
jgi:hypothetical protein